ncbi:MAG: portal protein [Ilumatobacteraceae bacterium]
MARPSNADRLGKYRKHLATSKRWRREEGYDSTWRRLIDLYRGRHYEFASDEDRLLVNIAFSTVNVIAPSVSVNYPKIAVNATKPDDAPKAIITEAVINYWWRHYKVKPEFRRAVKDFLVVGHGWLKCGYRYIEEEVVETGDEPSDPDAEGNEVTPSIVVVEDRPFVERVSPFDMFIDPDATSMRDAKWIAQRIRRPMADVKADKRYAKQARDRVAPSSTSRFADETGRKKIHDDGHSYVDIWEFYDVRTKTMSVFAEGGDQFLIKPTQMPYAFGHPFVMIRNYDVPDHFYPMGDLEAIEPLQRELNETRTQMMNHRKRFSRKYLFKESAFDSDGRSALESDYDNVLVPVASDESLSNVVAPFPAVITPPEFYNQSEMIQGDVEQITGVSEYQRGALPEIRRTATEAAIMQDAANARAADKLATIEGAIVEVAVRMVQLAQQYMTGQQVARVTGKDGVPMWVTFDRDYISGEFDFEVEAGSTAPNNESFRRQSALQMVDAMAPFASAGVINVERLAAHVLQFGFGIKNPGEFIQAVPDAQVAPEAVPAQMPVPMPEPPPAGPAGVAAPPAANPMELSGVDPAVLAALSSRLGVALPNSGGM